MKKVIRLLLAFSIVILLFHACKKNTDGYSENILNSQASNIIIKNGVVTFSTSATFLKIAENKNNDQNSLFRSLNEAKFKSLKTKIPEEAGDNFTPSVVTSSTFDSSLYTDYMLSVLNTDKVCNINGFYIKIDMENNLCAALDATLYSNEYNDFVNNNFNNDHIMVFVQQEEPVLAVLDAIRTNQTTWQNYRDSLLPAKGGGGICIKAGDNGIKKVAQFPINPISPNSPNFQLRYAVMVLSYIKNFIHFELNSQAYATRLTGFGVPVISCAGTSKFTFNYYYEGACGGSHSGERIIYSEGCSNTGNYNIYSGGTALRYTQITAKVAVKPNGYSGSYESYYVSPWANMR